MKFSDEYNECAYKIFEVHLKHSVSARDIDLGLEFNIFMISKKVVRWFFKPISFNLSNNNTHNFL